MGTSLTSWKVFPMMWCLCSWMLCILKVKLSYWKEKSFSFETPNSVSWLPGEWQTQFDPSVTSKGVFYLDNKNSVSVDMMKSSQYPFRLLHDPELKSQVNQQLSGAAEVFPDAEATTSGKWCWIKKRWNKLNSSLYRLPVFPSRETPASSLSCPCLAVETCHQCFQDWTSQTSIDVYLRRK